MSLRPSPSLRGAASMTYVAVSIFINPSTIYMLSLGFPLFLDRFCVEMNFCLWQLYTCCTVLSCDLKKSFYFNFSLIKIKRKQILKTIKKLYCIRANPIAPVDEYLKDIFEKFILLTGEIVDNVYMPIRKQQIKNFKICNFTALLLFFCGPVCWNQ